jgi:hypothetical protein
MGGWHECGCWLRDKALGVLDAVGAERRLGGVHGEGMLTERIHDELIIVVVSMEDNLPPSKKADDAVVDDNVEDDGSSVSVDVEDDVEDDESSLSWMLWMFATKKSATILSLPLK